MFNAETICTPPLGFCVIVHKTHIFYSLTITHLSSHGTGTTLFLLRNSCPKMTSKSSIDKTIKFARPFQYSIYTWISEENLISFFPLEFTAFTFVLLAMILSPCSLANSAHKKLCKASVSTSA
jgi:hypothetical protein